MKSDVQSAVVFVHTMASEWLSVIWTEKKLTPVRTWEPLQFTQESLRRKDNLVFTHQAPVTAWHTMVHYQLVCGDWWDTRGRMIEHICRSWLWSGRSERLWHFKEIQKYHKNCGRRTTALLSTDLSELNQLLTTPPDCGGGSGSRSGLWII